MVHRIQACELTALNVFHHLLEFFLRVIAYNHHYDATCEHLCQRCSRRLVVDNLTLFFTSLLSLELPADTAVASGVSCRLNRIVRAHYADDDAADSHHYGI